MGSGGATEDGGESPMDLFAQSRSNWLFLETEYHFGPRQMEQPPDYYGFGRAMREAFENFVGGGSSSGGSPGSSGLH